jgi:(R,R)-butanediol dehydrogenase/meso-butanediol dehydrogenase/diacetyl reductase
MREAMHAAVFKGQNLPLVLEKISIPRPGKDQLLLRVRACGICGSDIHESAATRIQPGTVLGHEFSGEVIEIGEDVQNWSIGDRLTALPSISCGRCDACQIGDLLYCKYVVSLGFDVNCNGGYAEYLCVGASSAIKIDDNVSYAKAAAIEPLAVGLDALRRAKLKPGESVLIIGAGPIGLTIAHWARFFGATHVVVSEKNATRMDLAKKMGATHVINGGTAKDVRNEYFDVVKNRPDVIFEAVGIPGMIKACIDMAPYNGRIVVVGVCQTEDTFMPRSALVKRLSIIFSAGYTADDYSTIVKLISQGRIDPEPMLTHQISMSELPNMFERLRNPTDEVKVIITP